MAGHEMRFLPGTRCKQGRFSTVHQALLLGRILRQENKRRSCKGLSSLKQVTLPNGLDLACVSKEDVRFLYQEIFVDQTYLRHGLSIAPGDTVIDIGANLGLFSVFAAGLAGPQGRVIAAEPIPRIFDALTQNLKSHRKLAEANGLDIAVVEAVMAGVANGDRKTAEFDFYPRAAGWSTSMPDSKEVGKSMRQYLVNAVQEHERLSESFIGGVAESLLRILPRRTVPWASRILVAYMLGKKQSISCPLCTVSDLINKFQLARVDFLKIDVERGELDVLEGIAKADWPRIRALALEVHDFGGRVATVAQILESNGFKSIVSEETSVLKSSGLVNVYASRSGDS